METGLQGAQYAADQALKSLDMFCDDCPVRSCVGSDRITLDARSPTPRLDIALAPDGAAATRNCLFSAMYARYGERIRLSYDGASGAIDVVTDAARARAHRAGDPLVTNWRTLSLTFADVAEAHHALRNEAALFAAFVALALYDEL